MMFNHLREFARHTRSVSPANLLFVHIGRELPHWLIPTLHQARVFNSCEIVLAAESKALAGANLSERLGVTAIALEELGVSEKHRMFRHTSPLDHTFRDGFWTHTSERFFVVESVMDKLRLQHVVHVENDVMLYCELDALVQQLAALYPGIAATFDNDMRCVPGIVYFPDQAAVASL